MSHARMRRIMDLAASGQFERLWYSTSIRLKGLDFSPETLEQLGLSSDLAVHYSDSGGPNLSDVLKRIPIPPDSRIIDFGCGKGGAACTMARFPFREVVGIDICDRLVVSARENARKLRVHADFLCHDATTFTDLDRFTHAYFFNPFPQRPLQIVRENLSRSLKRNPRKLTLICKYAEGSIQDYFPDSAGLRLVNKIVFRFDHPFYVFEQN